MHQIYKSNCFARNSIKQHCQNHGVWHKKVCFAIREPMSTLTEFFQVFSSTLNQQMYTSHSSNKNEDYPRKHKETNRLTKTTQKVMIETSSNTLHCSWNASLAGYINFSSIEHLRSTWFSEGPVRIYSRCKMIIISFFLANKDLCYYLHYLQPLKIKSLEGARLWYKLDLGQGPILIRHNISLWEAK